MFVCKTPNKYERQIIINRTEYTSLHKQVSKLKKLLVEKEKQLDKQEEAIKHLKQSINLIEKSFN